MSLKVESLEGTSRQWTLCPANLHGHFQLAKRSNEFKVFEGLLEIFYVNQLPFPSLFNLFQFRTFKWLENYHRMVKHLRW